jgi:protein phosphatase
MGVGARRRTAIDPRSPVIRDPLRPGSAPRRGRAVRLRTWRAIIGRCFEFLGLTKGRDEIVIESPRLAELSDDFRVDVGAATDAGGRDANEDAVHAGELPTLGPPAGDGDTPVPAFLLVVADGMGGHHRGEIASRLAVDTIVRLLEEDPGADTALLLKQAFRRANEAIFESGRGNGSEIMGTTLVAAVLRGKDATVASIGDSRAYLLRADQLTQITKDHSLVAEQVAHGSMTEQEARESPHRNILTQALGHRPKLDPKMPDIFELPLLPQDRLLLCSDGFYDVVKADDYARLLVDHPPDEAARRLVALAVERGTTDNVSAAVAQAVPTRVPSVTAETLAAGTSRGPLAGNFAVVVAAIAIILFVAIVLLALTVL